jgi:hypothetical protein
MKSRGIALAIASTAALLLASCADEYGYGPPAGYADVDYTAYYDGYYGPFYGGYWGPSGYFYYYDGSHRYHRDSGHHFRRDGVGGRYRPVQGHAPGPRGHGGGPPRH